MRLFLTLLLTALPAWAINSRHTYTTPEELQGFGDFNNDGHLDALVVERATGLYRVGLGQADGSLAWQAPKPSGCPDAEALAVGPIRSAVDTFAVTGKSANRIFLIDPTPAYTRPLTLTPPGIGPASVAAVDLNLAGNDPALLDLVVASHWNSPSTNYQRHLFQSLSSGVAATSTLATGSTPLERISRVQLDTAGPEVFSTILRGATDSLRLLDSTTASLPILSTLPSLAASTDFVHSPFLGAALSQFILYVPGAPGIQMSEWNGSSLGAPVAKAIGADPVRSVHLTDDGTSIGIAVIYNDGDHADLYTFDPSGNPVFAGTITPPPGEKLKGILGTSPGHFSALSGPPGSASTTTTPYSHDGSNWNAGTPTPLPGLTATSTRANVFVYDKEPIVNPDAKLVETLHVPDWTSTFAITGSPGGMDITVETFAGETTGLDASALTVVPDALASAADALVNQNQPEVAVSTTSSLLGTVPIQITIDPPAGTYSRIVSPQLQVPDATGITAYYRTDLADPWTTYTFGTPIAPPGDTLTPFTIWFYAEDSSRRSPVHRADYAFTGEPGSLDSDGDGVPDFVEIAKGLDPTAGPDSDNDGMSDLEELLYGSDPANGAETATYGSDTLDLPPSRTHDEDGDGYSDFAEWAAGSNPFDAGDTPSADALVEYGNTFDLNVRPLSHSGTVATQPDRESFPAGDPTYSPTDIRAHDLAGRLLATAPTDNHGSTLADPHARLESLPATGRDLFVIASTPTTFDCDQTSGDPGGGRELIGLVPIPDTLSSHMPIRFETQDVATWIADAQAHYGSLPGETVDLTLDLYDTLAYLLWERITGLKLEERDLITGPLPLGLTTFRDTIGDQSQTATAGDLLALQSYVGPADTGWLLQDLAQAIADEIATPTHARTTALKKLANEIYRISAGLNASSPGLYPSPFETLRNAIRGLPTDVGGVDGLIPLPGDDPTTPTSYAAAHTLTTTDLANTDEALIYFLSLLPARSTQLYSTTVTTTTFDAPVPVLEDDATLTGLRLYDADGNPFVFPQSFDLPVGTTLEILAFTDRSDLPAGDGTALETISATITGFPSGTTGDTNQNAIDDAYEDYFFGGPVDPFGDEDGDGYINLQEALDGTHPGDPSSTPTGAPLPAGLPPVEVSIDGPNLVFVLEYPSAYGDRIEFLLQDSGGTLSAPFVETSDAATDGGGDLYSLTIPRPVDSPNFYRFRLALRP